MHGQKNIKSEVKCKNFNNTNNDGFSKKSSDFLGGWGECSFVQVK